MFFGLTPTPEMCVLYAKGFRFETPARHYLQTYCWHRIQSYKEPNNVTTTNFTEDELIDRIVMDLEVSDIDDLIVEVATETEGPGACTRCGDVFVHVLVDEKTGWCDACGEDSVKSLLVLAGVV